MIYLAFSSLVAEDKLLLNMKEILSNEKNLLFEYDFKKNTALSNKLEKSWINPIMLRYNRNYSEQYGDKTIKTGSFTVSIDQPIFRSGGIYYAIKYARALRDENEKAIKLKKQEMIVQAVKLLFQMRQIELQLKKLKLQIANDEIDIHQKREAYDAGILDSSFLDQAILKKNQDETFFIEMQIKLQTVKNNFHLLSDKDPNTLDLPHLKLLPSKLYKKNNLELKRMEKSAQKEYYNSKMTWAKYLPVLSIQGRYTDADINPLFAASGSGLKEKYRNYGFTLSMPLDINMFADVEASKVAVLKAKTELIDKQKEIDSDYQLIRKKLTLLTKKIALAKKNEKLYKNLYQITKNLVKAGEKTKYDAQMLYNSMKMKTLERKIYTYDKEMLLLDLYAKVENEF